MTLISNTKLGPYEIQSPLGAGGMGEVYRARDTRLDRVVAIKVLASHLSSSAELKQRMEREAKAISSLNHPNICQLYDIGSQDGTDYFVMEFLEGQTLADRLRAEVLPLPEVYKIGIAIAEALAFAHRHGIVHRDLKPGNIMLTQTGAKLMDFGLAKPAGIQAAGSGSASAPPSFTAAATLSGPSPLTPLTTAGTIIGTIQYMAPEQIEGKEADARSDIFAFGAVLYEMATRKRPFQGKSQISLASAILEQDPTPIGSVKPLVPAPFEHVVMTCLQKNPEDRFQSANDIKLQLQWVAAAKPAAKLSWDSSSGVGASAAVTPSRRPLIWAATLIAGLLLGAIAGFVLHRPPPAPSIHMVINPPEETQIDLTGDNAGPPVISPDGSMIAFAATGRDGKTTIWVRSANSLEVRELKDTEGAIFPFWSFDSRSIAFFADAKLKVVETSGGSAQVIADAGYGRGGTWGANRVIVYAPATQDRLYRVNANGGAPTPLTTLDVTQHTSHRWPFFLPDGVHFLYSAINHDPSKSGNDTVYYASVDGSVNKPLLKSKSNAIYADGYLLFARNEQLLAQPFNPSSGTLSGEPQTLAKDVANDPTTWHMDVAAANSGLLLYGTGGGDYGTLELYWVDLVTKKQSIIAEGLTNVNGIRLSPQGDRIALEIDNGVSDIWVHDLARGIRTRLTFGPIFNNAPLWSPDGRWIAYTSNRNGKFQLFRKPSDGGGAEEELLSDDQLLFPGDWSHDGKYILYGRGIPGAQDIWALPLEGDRKPFQVVPTTPHTFRSDPKLSPDGRWLAYLSNESGSAGIYVTGFRGSTGKWQVSANQGLHPLWGRDGKELYYATSGNTVWAMPVKQVAGALQFGAPHAEVTNWSTPDPFFQVSPDGKKILLYRVSQQVGKAVTVVSNFASALME
ncbi:MAG: protein kinase [Acidobacteria bacterium]|nr:protein kinase [Acidobacteriota bacterium]